MLVTLVGIVTLVRLVQALNAPYPDIGDAVGDRDAGQAGAGHERLVPDAGDRQAINRVWNGYRPVETVAFRDGDSAVIDQVIVLGLHRDGECQYQQQWQQPLGEGWEAARFRRDFYFHSVVFS
jgi:hypothetical protein